MATRSAYRWLLIGGCACGALAAGTAQAQTSGAGAPPSLAAEGAPDAAPAAREEIVVTGSRIARPD